jgi:hypothetical protein
MDNWAEKRKVVLEKYKPQILAGLEEKATMFKMIGMGDYESPRWFIFGRCDFEAKTIKFESSQKGSLFFTVPVEEDDLWAFEWYDKVAEWYRPLKYNYLRENHPTIDIGGN